MKWQDNEKSQLAKAVGIYQHRLSEYAQGKRRPSVDMAKHLEVESLNILGPVRQIPAAAWLQLETHPLLTNYIQKEQENGRESNL